MYVYGEEGNEQGIVEIMGLETQKSQDLQLATYKSEFGRLEHEGQFLVQVQV